MHHSKWRTICIAAFFTVPFHVDAADEAVVVTASRFPEQELDMPVGLTVIRADRIAGHTARTLPELLAQEAGISSRDSSGSPDRQIDMRGFGVTGDQNTLVLINGQRLNDIELNTVRWSSIPLESIDRIEIMRGSGAVLYGGGATGGTINIITKPAILDKKEASLGATAGTYGTREVRAGINGSASGIAIGLHFNDFASDNFRANNRVEQYNFGGEVRAQGEKGHASLQFGADSQNLRLPGERTAAELQSDPRGTRRAGDYSSRDGHRISLGGDFRLGAGEFAVELGYRDSARAALLRDYTFGVFDTYTDTRLRVWSLTPRFKMPFKTFGFSNNLVAGIDLDDWDYDSRRSSSLETLSNPVARIIADQKNSAFYLQNQTALTERTKLSVGYRQQRASMSATDRVNPASYAGGSTVSWPKAWELALRHEFTPQAAGFLRSGQSFRVSTVDEVYSQFGGPFFDSMVTLLAPQRSRDHEIGIEYRKASIRGRASVFAINLENEIHFYAPTFSNINLPPTQRKGLELDGAMDITPAIMITANISFTQARFRSGVLGGVDVSGKHIPLVPQTLANLGVTWRIDERWKVLGTAQKVGRQYYDNDQLNTFPSQMPSFAVFDMKLTHERGDWTASLAANNILDKQYYNYAIRNGVGTSFNAYPQAGRTMMASLQLRFH